MKKELKLSNSGKRKLYEEVGEFRTYLNIFFRVLVKKTNI